MNAVENLLEELDDIREQLLVAIEPLPDEVLEQAGVVAEWSIADILVNLTVWESELVTGLRKIDPGKKPGNLLAALAKTDEFNQLCYAENINRDLERIFDDLMKVRLALEEWLESFSEKQLTDTKRYKYFNGRSLAHIIRKTTIENERRFLPAIKRFVQTWQAAEADKFIPLTAVNSSNINKQP
jgi:hypothetical protein